MLMNRSFCQVSRWSLSEVFLRGTLSPASYCVRPSLHQGSPQTPEVVTLATAMGALAAPDRYPCDSPCLISPWERLALAWPTCPVQRACCSLSLPVFGSGSYRMIAALEGLTDQLVGFAVPRPGFHTDKTALVPHSSLSVSKPLRRS